MSAADTAKARPLGLTNARFYPYLEGREFAAEFASSLQRQRRGRGLGPNARLPTAHFLLLSGGGDNGAFGAGLLVGWSDAGNRPEFSYVTGVSAGALIAPFAFLGKDYDQRLRAVFTTISASDVFEERWFGSALLDDALTDTTRMYNLISRHVDARMVQRIAEEYGKGRLLFIGTTNLDAERPVLWNIGAIAASGHPDSIELIRKILRASAAVPGVFQPVLFDVDVAGVRQQELHVDGGAVVQMFLHPVSVDFRAIAHRERKAYLVRNAREDPEWAKVERRFLSIAGRAISTMIHASGRNDLLRIYFMAQRERIDYNLAYIGSDFSAPRAGDFDRAYMNALFDYAYRQARRGYAWRKKPPGLDEEAH